MQNETKQPHAGFPTRMQSLNLICLIQSLPFFNILADGKETEEYLTIC